MPQEENAVPAVETENTATPVETTETENVAGGESATGEGETTNEGSEID